VKVHASCGSTKSAERLGLQIWANYKNGNLSDDKLERTNEVAQRLKQIGKQYALEALKKLS